VRDAWEDGKNWGDPTGGAVLFFLFLNHLGSQESLTGVIQMQRVEYEITMKDKRLQVGWTAKAAPIDF
jgi:hypothetical protein